MNIVELKARLKKKEDQLEKLNEKIKKQQDDIKKLKETIKAAQLTEIAGNLERRNISLDDFLAKINQESEINTTESFAKGDSEAVIPNNSFFTR